MKTTWYYDDYTNHNHRPHAGEVNIFGDTEEEQRELYAGMSIRANGKQLYVGLFKPIVVRCIGFGKSWTPLFTGDGSNIETKDALVQVLHEYETDGYKYDLPEEFMHYYPTRENEPECFWLKSFIYDEKSSQADNRSNRINVASKDYGKKLTSKLFDMRHSHLVSDMKVGGVYVVEVELYWDAQYYEHPRYSLHTDVREPSRIIETAYDIAVRQVEEANALGFDEEVPADKAVDSESTEDSFVMNDDFCMLDVSFGSTEAVEAEDDSPAAAEEEHIETVSTPEDEIPTENNRELDELKAEIARLTVENEMLKAEIAALKAANTASANTSDEDTHESFVHAVPPANTEADVIDVAPSEAEILMADVVWDAEHRVWTSPGRCNPEYAYLPGYQYPMKSRARRAEETIPTQ